MISETTSTSHNRGRLRRRRTQDIEQWTGVKITAGCRKKQTEHAQEIVLPTYWHTWSIQGAPVKSIPYNLLPITRQRFKLILQYFAVVLNAYIDIYLPSYFSIWLPVRKILQIKCSYLKIFTLRAKLSGAVYCNRSCLWRAGVVTGGRAVSEPYYSQRARAQCLRLWALFHWTFSFELTNSHLFQQNWIPAVYDNDVTVT